MMAALFRSLNASWCLSFTCVRQHFRGCDSACAYAALHMHAAPAGVHVPGGAWLRRHQALRQQLWWRLVQGDKRA
jgi:hypothetical protein